MKKLIALLLALAMCFSLVACDGRKHQNNNEMQTEAEDKMNATNAIAETPNAIIESSVYEMETTAPQSKATAENVIVNHPLLQYMYGSWEMTDKEEGAKHNPYTTLILNEDGTCVVDGVNMIWEINNQFTTDAELALDFYADSEKICGAKYMGDGEEFYAMVTNGAICYAEWAHN